MLPDLFSVSQQEDNAMKKLALYIVVGVALLGCGDDDSNSSSNPNPDPNTSVKLMSGFYTGTTDEGEVLDGLVDDDSKMWFTYAEIAGGEEQVIGFVTTNSPVLLNNSNFSAAAKNYPYDNRGSQETTINGTYKSNVITGTILEVASNSIEYTLNFNTASLKTHTLNLIDGKTFTGPLYVTSGTGAAEATIAFTTNGNFTGEDSEGCKISGKFTPAVSERYYTTSVTFDQTKCIAAGETLTGVSILDDGNADLLILGSNGSEGRGMYFGS
ncbi:MAG: hypothetical protein L0G25_08315 [Psychrobacter sp.]|nr:hypothetical protein [Psychrobacter sp.]